jgi:RNA polymerase sigma-70 factor (ECF subfamily)
MGVPVRSYETLDEEAINSRLSAGPLRDDLLRALDALPAAQRDAVALRVIHERSYDEVAVALECTAATARQRVGRGLQTMRERLSESAS